MAKATVKSANSTAIKFEAVNLDSIFPTLDAIAWLDLPSLKSISQFAGIDPRTAGKVLKNCIQIGVIQSVGQDTFTLTSPYPYKGSIEQKKAVIKEALVRLPLIVHMKQFQNLGDTFEIAARKAATVVGILDYDPKNIMPLLKWAKSYNVIDPAIMMDDLIEEAVHLKEERHRTDSNKIVAFISHSSKDKPFIRQLTTDLTKAGVSVWLDEQKILVGDSITEKVSQGLAESDYFLLALSEASVSSPWVQKELNSALISEIEKRKVKILPLKLSECEIPTLIKDKKYADFTGSYKSALNELIKSLNQD